MTTAVVGASLSALVAALELGRQSEPVVLISHGERWGGHFAGIDACGHHFDAGMAIIELTSGSRQEEPDLTGYDVHTRNDVGRFFGTVEAYVSELVPLRVIDTPQCYFRSSWNEDFLLCNRFEVFARFSRHERDAIVAELDTRSRDDWRHASNKIRLQDVHAAASYFEVSRYNHGAALHDQLIEPFARGLTHGSTREVSAIYHRRLWSPLYYPETLAESLQSGAKAIGDTLIHYPDGGSFASFAEAILDAMKRCDSVRIIDSKVVSLEGASGTLALENGERVVYERLVWGGKLRQAYPAFGEAMMQDYSTRHANLTFAFMAVDSDRITHDFSILFNVDSELPCYRVTNHSNCAGEHAPQSRLLMEFNTDQLAERGVRPEQVAQQATAALLQLGVIDTPEAVRDIAVKAIPRLLPICDLSYNEITNQSVALLKEKIPGLVLMGDASTMTTRSFADNIVQGLKFAHCGTV